jgi:2-succinyl-5-enolpyruvyl-6-hydroxy-3-cyclohexene-1-carboxylate synthase
MTLWLAVIVAVLLILLTEDRPPHLSDVAWLQAVGHILFITIRDSS